MHRILPENKLPCFKEFVAKGKCKTLSEKTGFRGSSSVFNGCQKNSLKADVVLSFLQEKALKGFHKIGFC